MAHRVEHRSDNYDVIGAVPRDLGVIKNFLKRDSAVKRLIDMEEEMLEIQAKSRQRSVINPKCPPLPGKPAPCDIPANQDADQATCESPCATADPCRQRQTSLQIEEVTPPKRTHDLYSNAVFLDEETVVGRAFPVKFRITRNANKCVECGKRNHLLCTPTENTSVVLLTNCCDVMVWPSQKVEQMNKVPVTMITGYADLTEYTLDENTVM